MSQRPNYDYIVYICICAHGVVFLDWLAADDGSPRQENQFPLCAQQTGNQLCAAPVNTSASAQRKHFLITTQHQHNVVRANGSSTTNANAKPQPPPAFRLRAPLLPTPDDDDECGTYCCAHMNTFAIRPENYSLLLCCVDANTIQHRPAPGWRSCSVC